MPPTDDDKPRSIASNGTRASKKKKNRRRRAKQWTYLIENLKGSIDALYEVCRNDQSIPGCKEVILHLQDGNRDFEALIETINVELEWGNEQKHQAVAWEIRKSMSSPGHVVDKIGIEALPLYPMVLAEVVRNAEREALEKAREEEKEKQAAVLEKDEGKDEDGWKLVTGRRRKSASSTTASEYADREMSVESEQNDPPRLNVYERLSGGASSCRRHSTTAAGEKSYAAATKSSVCSGKSVTSRLNPKSAMGLPQTKASMAKVAYTRQRLWEKHQPELTEKFKAQQRKERMKEIQSTRSTSSINFSDVSAVRRITQEFRTQKIQRRQQQSAPVSEVNRSLQSITETGEGEDEKLPRAPDTPKKTARNSPIESIPADPVHTSPNRPTNSNSIKLDAIPRCSKSEPIGSLSSSTTPPPLDLEGDLEWREMTEEEESLALEEHSLKLVIQREESVSIDAELERQVAVEAELLEKEEEERMRKEEEAKKAEEPAPTFSDIVRKWEADMKEYAAMSWSEIMEKEVAGNYHEPGTLVEKREKMNSPSRRRCDRNDSDFSKKHEEKLKRADELRAKLQEQKAARLRELMQRVEEVRAKREAIIEKKRIHLENKMERAQENREKNLTEIVKKAKDDEQKVMEVKFINALQDDNFKQDLKIRDAGIEERRQALVDERTRKIEEKAAKELAAEERRKLAEAERQARLQEMVEKKEARHSQVLAQKEEIEREKKEKRRIQKERQEENRQTVTTPTGDRKEERKRPTSAKLHCRWEHLSDPSNWPDDTQLKYDIKCTVCNEVMTSELDAMAHVVGKTHFAKVKEFKMLPADLETQIQRYLQEIDSKNPDQEEESGSESDGKLREWCTSRSPSQILQNLSCSPRAQNRIARELANRLEDVDLDKKINDSTLKVVEKKIGELIGICDEKSKCEPISDQLIASNAMEKLYGMTFRQIPNVSESLRLQMCTLLSKLLCFPRAVSLLSTGPHLENLLTSLIERITADSKFTPLSVALCSVLTSALATISNEKNAGKFMDLEANEFAEMVSSFLLSSQFVSGCKNSIDSDHSVDIPTALVNLTAHFLQVNENFCRRLVFQFTSLLLQIVVRKIREEGESKLEEITMRLLFSMANGDKKCEDKDSHWKTLLSSPHSSLRIRLLLGNVLSRLCHQMDAEGSGVRNAQFFQTLLLVRFIANSGMVYKRLLILGDSRHSVPILLARLPLTCLVFPSNYSPILVTLCDLVYNHEDSANLLNSELSLKHLIEFLKKQNANEENSKMVQYFCKVVEMKS
ncbi:hypothetical protein WR25_25704 isoform A [Diploscapter pachys]|uniref:S phase cyclin A-associated protein in the endoplasmic reticulum N-terminal domain-containing protein n=2 Tax=Diploscapter pachys TaxID=2018661 RepID=A0A2A2LXQ9_9BILA|nr:hypothetical protein WR25_25704 isoform A [Diploscapter pachys]